MPGACRPGRECVPGDPYASRDYLMLLAASSVQCEPIDTDDYGRSVMRCWAVRPDLSCVMVKAGQAVERYGQLSCWLRSRPYE